MVQGALVSLGVKVNKMFVLNKDLYTKICIGMYMQKVQNKYNNIHLMDSPWFHHRICFTGKTVKTAATNKQFKDFKDSLALLNNWAVNLTNAKL